MMSALSAVPASIELSPLSPALGARVNNVSLSGGLDPAIIEQLRAALDEFGLLLFRDQSLTTAEHIAFSEQFGALQEVAQKQYQLVDQPLIYVIGNVREDGRAIGDPSVGRIWHSDQSFLRYPAYGSVLYGVTCPPEGAETEFANSYLAYETLDPALKEQVDGAWCVHSFAEYYEELRHRDATQPELSEDRRARFPDVRHPLVRRNPRTGRRALYVNPAYATRIEGLDLAHSRALLARLCAHACSPGLVYAHRWRDGDVLFWDNLGVTHRGTAFDEQRYVRRMHRTTIAGDAAGYAATLL